MVPEGAGSLGALADQVVIRDRLDHGVAAGYRARRFHESLVSGGAAQEELDCI